MVNEALSLYWRLPQSFLFSLFNERIWSAYFKTDTRSSKFVFIFELQAVNVSFKNNSAGENSSQDFLTDYREWLTWLDEIMWLWKLGWRDFFRAHCASFHIHSSLPLFLRFISILLYSCASVRESTLAWFPVFL